ncbi:MAG: hypothetical protein AAGK78_07565, partial [Planctomycetota bacterium]
TDFLRGKNDLSKALRSRSTHKGVALAPHLRRTSNVKPLAWLSKIWLGAAATGMAGLASPSVLAQERDARLVIVAHPRPQKSRLLICLPPRVSTAAAASPMERLHRHVHGWIKGDGPAISFVAGGVTIGARWLLP